MWLSVVSLLFVGAASAQQLGQCRTSDVKKVSNLDERALAGSWYEARLYHSRLGMVPYANHALKISMGDPGLFVTEYIRSPSGEPCRVLREGRRRRLDNAVYEYYRAELQRYVLAIVVYTDYQRYLVEFHCLERSGDFCLNPEVSYYLRQPLMGNIALHFPYIEQHLKDHKVCVDPKMFMDISVKEPPCTPVTNPMKSVINPVPPPGSRDCMLSKVEVMSGLDEDRLTGSWYEMRWYHSPGSNTQIADSFALSIAKQLPGLFVMEYHRYPSRECELYNRASRKRICNGVYEFYRQDVKKYIRSYIVYTDYDRYLTEFLCLEKNNADVCLNFQVSFYSRQPSPDGWPGQVYFDDQIGMHHLCVDPNKFIQHPAKEASCIPLTHPLKPTKPPKVCMRNMVKVMKEVDENRLAGSWYEVRWYYHQDEIDDYENYALGITADNKLPGMFVKEHVRYPPGANCSVFNEATRRRIDNGVYEFYRRDLEQNALMYVVYTDYDKYLTEFLCLGWDGDICLQPEVSFYTREPFPALSSISAYPEDVMSHLQKNNLEDCVDQDKYHRGPTRTPVCTPVTHSMTTDDGTLQLTEGSTCMCLPYDAEILTLMKEKEKAEIEKLVVEKEALVLEREQLSLQIAALQSRVNVIGK